MARVSCLTHFWKTIHFLIAGNHVCFYWLRTLVEVESIVLICMDLISKSSQISSSSIVVRGTVCQPLARNSWFQQHDLVTESVIQFRCQQDCLKTFRSCDYTPDGLRKRGLLRDSFSKDQILSSSTKYPWMHNMWGVSQGARLQRYLMHLWK